MSIINKWLRTVIGMSIINTCVLNNIFMQYDFEFILVINLDLTIQKREIIEGSDSRTIAE